MAKAGKAGDRPVDDDLAQLIKGQEARDKGEVESLEDIKEDLRGDEGRETFAVSPDEAGVLDVEALGLDEDPELPGTPGQVPDEDEDGLPKDVVCDFSCICHSGDINSGLRGSDCCYHDNELMEIAPVESGQASDEGAELPGIPFVPWAERVGDELVEIVPDEPEAEAEEDFGNDDEDYVLGADVTEWAAASDQSKRSCERGKDGRLNGETPVKYRMVFELDPPIKGNKKVKDPVTGELTNDIRRLELFGSSEMSFYMMEIILSRNTKPGQIRRMEAVILTEESKVAWQDRNPGETE